MTKKQPSLTAALHQAASSKPVASPIVAATDTPQVAARAKSQPAPASRAGKKMISAHFDPAVARQLKQLALDRETTLQNLMAEALNDLFAKHGRQRIA
jgi:hypothetical protein